MGNEDETLPPNDTDRTRSLPPTGETPLPAGSLNEGPGDQIGPFKLVEWLGAGTFGTVWLAERSEPYRQKVALKIVNAAVARESVIARFEQERQALALMNHPNVAKVLDGGITPLGRPYFAMELVEGAPVTEYCDRRGLGITARLQIFRQICDAVQHAHSKGIIHRDLKPSNILAADGDGGVPQIKVIDWGIAKAISHTITAKEVFTAAGIAIGTPEYMSPEQAEIGSDDIDTRSDVYSLGIVLYELLTGLLPFEPRMLRSAAVREMQRIIREVDPPTPSSKVIAELRGGTRRGSEIATARKVDMDELAETLRRELEWIPLKAMRKQRDERYASPLDLARDVENYLAGRPLVAGPESSWYRTRKFVRRNRGPVLAAGVVLLSILGGLAVALWQRSEAIAARDEERAARRESEAMNEFVIDDVFGAADAERYDAETRVVEILDGAVESVDDRFADDPRLRARMLQSLGRAYLGVGSPESAARTLERARSAADSASISASERGAIANDLVEALYRGNPDGSSAQAEAIAREALAEIRSEPPVNRRLESNALNQLGGALKHARRFPEARAAYQEALAIRTAILQPGDLDLLITRYNLALITAQEARAESDAARASEMHQKAVGEAREAAADALRHLPADHSHALSARNELGMACIAARRQCASTDPAAAERYLDEALATFRPLQEQALARLGPRHFRVVWISGGLSAAESDAGNHRAAADALEPVLAAEGTPTETVLRLAARALILRERSEDSASADRLQARIARWLGDGALDPKAVGRFMTELDDGVTRLRSQGQQAVADRVDARIARLR